MNESFTLVYLVHQIKSEFLELTLHEVPETSPEPDEQEVFGNLSPSAKSVQAILNYARLLEVADTGSVGKVEWILN
jgi:hypothetical protein